jgi:hypothetical protein
MIVWIFALIFFLRKKIKVFRLANKEGKTNRFRAKKGGNLSAAFLILIDKMGVFG